jgi:hypothetical protein
MTYNGWANYETWNVALWLGSDESLYRAAVTRVRGHVEGGRGKRLSTFRARDAERFVRALLPNGTGDISADDYRKVRWGAIAACIREMA